MKKSLLMLLPFLAVSLFADTEILKIGFEAEEGYALGKVIGQKGWTSTDSRHNSRSVYAVTNRASLVKSG